ISGVFGQRLARKYSLISVSVSSVKYSMSSRFEFRHVKYVSLWLKPALAKAFIILGLVNASARKIASGYLARTPSIKYSQNATGLVCGLSTRKMRTPRWAQKRTILFISAHSSRQFLHRKFSG